MCPPSTLEQCSVSSLQTSIRSKGKKKHHESKGPHKLHVTWLQWDDYTLLARILWRLLTGPHYIDSHLWLNVSTSFSASVHVWPASHYCSWRKRWWGGGSRTDQDSCGLVFCWQLNSESQWFYTYIWCISLKVRTENSGFKISRKKSFFLFSSRH